MSVILVLCGAWSGLVWYICIYTVGGSLWYILYRVSWSSAACYWRSDNLPSSFTATPPFLLLSSLTGNDSKTSVLLAPLCSEQYKFPQGSYLNSLVSYLSRDCDILHMWGQGGFFFERGGTTELGKEVGACGEQQTTPNTERVIFQTFHLIWLTIQFLA